MAFFLAGEITQVKESIPWVRCASGNVWYDHHHCCQTVCQSVSPCQCPSYSSTKHCDWPRSGLSIILILVLVSNIQIQLYDWKSISLLASNVSFETLPTDPPSGFIVLSVELLACWGVLTRLQTSTTSPVWMELNNFFWRAGLRWALATQGGL